MCARAGVSVCVCVLTAANFSYMSIFLHIRSQTYIHTHTREKTRWSFAWPGHENVSGIRRCSLVAPRGGIQQFLASRPQRRALPQRTLHAGLVTHTHTHEYTCLASVAQNDVEEAFINWPLTLFLSVQVEGVCSKWGSRFGFIAIVWL